MTVEVFVEAIKENQTTRPHKQLQTVLADVYSFIRSAEANQAFATVTLEQLMRDQIERNGESSRSNSNQYNPYSYSTAKTTPASTDPMSRANFLGASDTTLPTKYDRVLALTNNLSAVIEEIKAMSSVDVAEAEEYADAASISVTQEEGP